MLEAFPLTGALEDLKGRSGCGNMMSLVKILLEAEKPLMKNFTKNLSSGKWFLLGVSMKRKFTKGKRVGQF